METGRVLVVEDDLHGRNVVRTVLESAGISVDQAGDAHEAAGFLDQANAYSAVVIDLSLPEVSGWQLLQMIRANPTHSDTPCIAITAYHSSKVAQEALEAGFVAYIPKPIQVKTFADSVKRYWR